MANRILKLKNYQLRSLEALQTYFQACQEYRDPGLAFYKLTQRAYHEVPELPGLPYICLRLPTGGGKTILAAYAAGLAADQVSHTDHPLILWLVPSDPIREQTLKALQNLHHPYRQALESRLGRSTVLELSDLRAVQPGVLANGATVCVATQQAFKVENTDGRKVYEASGALMGHFPVGSDLDGLELYPDGKPLPSLANVIRFHRPVVIMDEAHNARTELSFETLARLRPACILEFTATPAVKDRLHPSNVLHSVSAAELKTEGMIKLPVRLECNPDWRVVLSSAVAQRNRLEALAREERAATAEYLRPILLIQAQPEYQHAESLTVQILREALIHDQRIPADQIAISTGKQDDLEGVDLSLSTCPVRFILTVQKLREGWDCPFAYILCALADQRSQTAVEQILGRVLRLPGAQKKTIPELNQAYAFTASRDFQSVMNGLGEALIMNGFERQEVKDLIQPAQEPVQQPLDLSDLPLFNNPQSEPIQIQVEEAPHLERLTTEIGTKVSYDLASHALTIRERLDSREAKALEACFNEPASRLSLARALAPTLKPARPEIAIPLLALRQGDFLEQFEASCFLERPWKLSGREPFLSLEDFPYQSPETQVAEVDISANGKVSTTFLGELHRQMSWLSADQDWTLTTLAVWLDKKIPHIDLASSQSLAYISSILESLIQSRGVDLGYLVKEQFRLKQAIEKKIQEYRTSAHQDAFQQFLLPGSGAELVVSPELCFRFDPDPMNYPCSPEGSLYPGRHSFLKHYYPVVGNLKPEGEEFHCAQFIDMLPSVKTWVRNLERRPLHSFWLQTATDRFYPDFVCLLNDERYLVVEYKGEQLYGGLDANEKLAIGQLWEERSAGHCLFVMPHDRRFESIRARIES